jgi:hypothetical protein
MLLEAVVIGVWAAVAAGCGWVVWRLAYQQGREDAGMGTCCKGHGEEHHEPPVPMPTPDEWDRVIDRILAESR